MAHTAQHRGDEATQNSSTPPCRMVCLSVLRRYITCDFMHLCSCLQVLRGGRQAQPAQPQPRAQQAAALPQLRPASSQQPLVHRRALLAAVRPGSWPCGCWRAVLPCCVHGAWLSRLPQRVQPPSQFSCCKPTVARSRAGQRCGPARLTRRSRLQVSRAVCMGLHRSVAKAQGVRRCTTSQDCADGKRVQ